MIWLLAALGLPVIIGLRVHQLGRRVRPPPRTLRTAVVLGARVHPDGAPSPALVDRVRVAVALLKEGHVERLLLTGGTPDARPAEATVMAALARSLGAPASALVLEPLARSTHDNARHSAALLATETEIALVTCDFHVARAAAQFRAHRLTVWPLPSRRQLDASTRLMVTAKEVVGLIRRPWLLWRL